MKRKRRKGAKTRVRVMKNENVKQVSLVSVQTD